MSSNNMEPWQYLIESAQQEQGDQSSAVQPSTFSNQFFYMGCAKYHYSHANYLSIYSQDLLSDFVQSLYQIKSLVNWLQEIAWDSVIHKSASVKYQIAEATCNILNRELK
jgi:hypothetical protein